LIKKRLQNQKITVKDLISCESTKSKFENHVATSPDGGEKISLNKLDISNRAVENLSSSRQMNERTNNQQEEDEDGNIIVLYDDTTSDVNDLLVDSNPLKIVQENIEKAGFNKECKILKGGFKQFFEMCPDLCRSETELKNNLINSHYYEQQADQHQHSIDNAIMTEITPFLYLGNELDAKNTTKLAQLGVFHILNVTRNIPFYDDHQPIPATSTTTTSPFVYKRIPVNDSINQNLREYFEEAIDFIGKRQALKKSFLLFYILPINDFFFKR
jgi:dual specificity MAP kinase phosphatase